MYVYATSAYVPSHMRTGETLILSPIPPLHVQTQATNFRNKVYSLSLYCASPFPEGVDLHHFGHSLNIIKNWQFQVEIQSS